MRGERLKNFLFSLAALLFMWLVWIVAFYIVRNDFVLPSFTDTFSEMGKLLAEEGFWRAFGGSFLRTLYAFAGSLVCGVALAALAVAFRPARALLAPFVSVLRTVPTMAVVLILLLWTSPAVAPVLVASLVLFPALYAQAFSALSEAEEEYGVVARAFRVGAGRRLFRFWLPVAAPPFLKQTGAVFAMGLKVVVSGEVLASTFRSLGGMMQEAQIYLNMPRLLALTILTVLLGFFFEGICALVYRIVVKWRRRA